MGNYTRTHVCVQCAASFVPKRSDRTTCCSRACGFELRRQKGIKTKDLYDEIRVYRRWSAASRARSAALSKLPSRRAAYLMEQAVRHLHFANRPCITCGEPVTYSGTGLPRSYCSRRCAQMTEDFKAKRRAAKALRRARQSGVTAERFDPIEILERDRWTCHICHTSTPQRLRGSTKDRAPELDHIIPLAAGGPHTRYNSACACRKCNQTKGADWIGQLRLAL